MTKDDKEILRLTLMAFENNSTNVNNIRTRNLNTLSFDESKELMAIEEKMNEVKNMIKNILVVKTSGINHLSMCLEIEEVKLNDSNPLFSYNNVD